MFVPGSGGCQQRTIPNAAGQRSRMMGDGLNVQSTRLNRRTVLKGLGTALALPLFDAMIPLRARAATGAITAPPRRMAFIFVPNGVHIPDWTPDKVGADFDLPKI